MSNWEKKGEQLEHTGRKMQQVGCLLTGLITLPVFGFFIWGIPGLLIGLLIGILITAGARASK